MPTSLRSVPDMVSDPFPSVEVFEANGTMQVVSKVVLPNGLNLVDFKHVNSKLLDSVSFKRASSLGARKGGWLLIRAGRPFSQ